jgi:hypothetical protein
MQLIFLGGGSRHHMLTDRVTKALLGPQTRERCTPPNHSAIVMTMMCDVCCRMKYSVKVHPWGIMVAVKLTWLLKTVLLRLDPALLAAPTAAAAAPTSDTSPEEGAPGASGGGNEEESREVVADTQDVMALLLPDGRASSGGKHSAADDRMSRGIGSGRLSRRLGQQRIFSSSSPPPGNSRPSYVQPPVTAEEEELVVSSGTSVLNKRRRLQQRQKAAAEKRAVAAATASTPPESEVVTSKNNKQPASKHGWLADYYAHTSPPFSFSTTDYSSFRLFIYFVVAGCGL